MSSFEREMKKKEEGDSFSETRVNIPVLKYFWQSSPLSGSKEGNIHAYLRDLKLFDNFTDNELRIFTQFTHERNFEPGEIIFNNGDSGFGFYMIFNGLVELYAERFEKKEDSLRANAYTACIAELGKFDYFGEIALMDNLNKRNASAVCKEHTTLFAIFRPDLEDMIEKHPKIAAKFYQSLSLVIVTRFKIVASDLKKTQKKMVEMDASKA
jgi:CRP/FNR family cyclic AMP-dependent transcriptional regulator